MNPVNMFRSLDELEDLKELELRSRPDGRSFFFFIYLTTDSSVPFFPDASMYGVTGRLSHVNLC